MKADSGSVLHSADHTAIMLLSICTLLPALALVSSQKVVTQKPSVRTQEKGNTVTMDCNIAKDESNYVSWYKQIPQEAPQFVLRFYHSHSSPDLYGDNFSSTRFTSKASTNIDYQLIIRNVETLLSGSCSEPSPPSSEELKSTKATLVCLANDVAVVLLITSLQSLLYLLLTLIISSLSTRVPSHTDTMLPALCSLFTALSCVSGVTVVTQKPPVLTLTQGQTATMDCSVLHSADHTAIMLLSICTLLPALALVSSQKVVTQKPSVRTQEKGNTVTMDCNIAKDESNYVSWYKQIPQEAPQFVLRFYHSHSSPDLYGDNFSSTRFTSKTSTNIDYQLIIRNVEVGDSAVYYCGTRDDSTNAALPAPVLNLLPPSSEELKSTKATLVCLANDVAGGFADVRWLVNGNPVTSGVITGSAQQQANKKFSLSSYLTIDSSEWENDKVITCEVSAGGKAASVKIKKSECSE
ncbi:hypothetical protein HF521_013777 [Silurus meridionalis]|uniref:Ig-like domain-containing protein n=1 Tax=Silurus meridionalis TaxID=175797 RepID=A0A8T0AD69_SILME|nr:hypothetical protein HF521_013777 [Silurus meridionalis]